MGVLTRLRQLSRSPLWQQSKLWLGLRLPVLEDLVLRLSRISLSKSNSSPDPRKLLSRSSSPHRSWASSGLRGGVPSPKDSEGLSSSRSLLLGRRGQFCKGKIWGGEASGATESGGHVKQAPDIGVLGEAGEMFRWTQGGRGTWH